MSDRICSVDSCSNPARGRGWCRSHYMRWWRYGDPLHALPEPDPLCSIPGCNGKVRGRGWCHAHWKRWRRHGDPLDGRTPNGEPLAWLRFSLAKPSDSCLNWPYNILPTGYGQVNFEGKPRLAHHVALILVGRTPPTGDQETRHACDNRRCVNPRHLLVGTHLDNMADMVERDRACRGERRSKKLTDEMVTQIRKNLEPSTHVAPRYGISPQNVRAIRRRETWKHIL